MGYPRKTKYEGITIVSPTSAQLYFRYQGEQCRERVKCDPTNTSHIEQLNRHLRGIEQAINDDTFVYLDVFPKSKRGRRFQNNRLLGTYLKRWHLAQKSRLKSSTWGTYRKSINHFKCLFPMRVADLKWPHIKEWAAGYDVKGKTLNNYISVLRTALDDAVDDGIIDVNPLLNRKLKTRSVSVKKDEIDPFSIQEQIAIIEASIGLEKGLIEFGFWTGLRISELIGLQWSKVDWIHKTVYIDKIRTEYSKELEEPKTAQSIRHVKLIPPALAVLQQMKQYTFLNGQEIFTNPKTGAAWTGDQQIRNMWVKVLKKAGVRYRYPYQMRHTFASSALMAGEHSGFVSKQLGHKNVAFTLRTYVRYIPGNDEHAGSKLESLWKQNIADNGN